MTCPYHPKVTAQFSEHGRPYCFACFGTALRASEPPELHEASEIIRRRLEDIRRYSPRQP